MRFRRVSTSARRALAAVAERESARDAPHLAHRRGRGNAASGDVADDDPEPAARGARTRRTNRRRPRRRLPPPGSGRRARRRRRPAGAWARALAGARSRSGAPPRTAARWRIDSAARSAASFSSERSVAVSDARAGPVTAIAADSRARSIRIGACTIAAVGRAPSRRPPPSPRATWPPAARTTCGSSPSSPTRTSSRSAPNSSAMR